MRRRQHPLLQRASAVAGNAIIYMLVLIQDLQWVFDRNGQGKTMTKRVKKWFRLGSRLIAITTFTDCYNCTVIVKTVILRKKNAQLSGRNGLRAYWFAKSCY